MKTNLLEITATAIAATATLTLIASAANAQVVPGKIAPNRLQDKIRLIHNQSILNANRPFSLSSNIGFVSHNYNRDALLVQFGE